MTTVGWMAVDVAVDACLSGGCLLLALIQENPMLAAPGVTAAIRSGELNLDDYDITDEAKEEILEMTNTIASNVNNNNSQSTQLAQTATGVQAQNFWDWVNTGLALSALGAGAEAVADAAIVACTYACPALLILVQENPQLAVPGVVAAVNSGDLNLDDYDIPTEAKDQLKGLAENIATI